MKAMNSNISSGAPGRIVIGAIWLYRRTLSPMLYAIGVRCRHQPTCSEYGAEAFRRHRFGRAFWLTVSRVSRCHPFGSHGFDPVPADAPQVGWKFWKLGDWAWTERPSSKEKGAKETDACCAQEKSSPGGPVS